MKNKILVIILVLALPVLSACGAKEDPALASPSPAEETGYTFTDDLGREVTLQKPSRVCAMIGSFADIWCLAGGKETLCAAADDTWTSFDLDLPETVSNIGTVKDPDLERIIEANPDLILCSCNTQSNKDLIPTLESLQIPFAFFDVDSIDDYLRMLKVCTDLTGCPENYETYGLAVKEQADAAIARQDGTSPRVLTMRATGSSCKVKGSEGFLLGEMLRDLGCVNIADSETSLLENLSMEAIIKEDPDYIFVVLQGSDSTKAQQTLQESLLDNPAWNGLTAVKEGRFYILEQNLYNLKPNDQWGIAYEKLSDILYGT